jgi:hypothetical protein
MSRETLQTLDAIQQVYGAFLKDALVFHLENEREAKTVTERTLKHAARIWEAAEGEGSLLEIVASTAVSQCGLLLPRFWPQKPRHIPSREQVFRYLETCLFEQKVGRLRERLERMYADAREDGTSAVADVQNYEEELDRLIDAFYRHRMRLPDDDDLSGGILCGVRPPPPERTPGAGRTPDEAREPPRNP